MASNERVGWALSVLKHLPSKNPVTAETTIFYALGLAGVSDTELTAAVAIAATRCTFLPTPAELIAFLPKPPGPDAEAVITNIRALADYHPARGTTWPRVEAVRAVLGDAVGEAYSVVGGGFRLFAGNETTASIARRDFAQALAQAVRDGLEVVARPVMALPGASDGAIVYDDRPRVTAGGFRRLGA